MQGQKEYLCKHNTSVCTSDTVKCRYCKGDHLAPEQGTPLKDRICPEFHKQKKIRDLVEIHKISFHEAINILKKQKANYNVKVNKVNHDVYNFPLLSKSQSLNTLTREQPEIVRKTKTIIAPKLKRTIQVGKTEKSMKSPDIKKKSVHFPGSIIQKDIPEATSSGMSNMAETQATIEEDTDKGDNNNLFNIIKK